MAEKYYCLPCYTHRHTKKNLSSLMGNKTTLLDPVSSFSSLLENCRALKGLTPSSTDRQEEGELICRLKIPPLFHCHS